ncbi:hypothetical protein CTI12_AA374290 [Artemisia annua]|uniref:Uncharacterized protein n=1 Tax=Artemisia annua TaxID=35608 RepID=A0A2U1MJ32_ARTAN|nr:hypothetical protein CTI12_AA374290 [Artemisia annua]
MSPDKVHVSKSGVPVSKLKEGKVRRHRHCIKIGVSSPGSASVGVGSILRNLHSSKASGKSRKHLESSPMDDRGGKRVIKSPNSDVNGMKSGSIDSNLKFEIGSIYDNKTSTKPVDSSGKALVKSVVDPISTVNGNDGSFINQPLDVSSIHRNCGLETSPNNPCAGDVDNISGCETGYRESTVGGKTGLVFGEQIAGSSVRNEHTSMEGVVNIGGACSNNLDGIACNKESMDFEFRKNDKSDGILKKPSIPLLSVQFGKNALVNPFIKKAASNSKIGNWSAGLGNAFGSTILSNQYSAVGDRFAKKLKKGTEEMALKMEYTLGFVSVQENGNRRIEFTAEEVYKGRPMIMDKMTKERCLKKAGKLDFARVLVEVSAEEDLPNVLEWKPPLCTFGKTFGHNTVCCKSRPRKEEEIAANIIKEAIMMKDSRVSKGKDVVVDDEGFSVFGKKNRFVVNNSFFAPTKPGNGSDKHGKVQYNAKSNLGGNHTFGSGQKTQKKNVTTEDITSAHATAVKSHNTGNGKKSLHQLSQDPNYKPKVLTRGSNSNSSPSSCNNENIPISNSFSVLINEEMLEGKDLHEKFDSKVWSDLKSEVNVLMEAGIYPSKAIRMDWSLQQMDYFYKNCHKFMLDPISEDVEDVQSETDGVAGNMKPEYVVDAADDMGNSAASNENVINGV